MLSTNAEHLKQFLERAGVTASDVAERLDRSLGYISGQINGHSDLRRETITAAHDLIDERLSRVGLLHFIVGEMQRAFVEGNEDPTNDRGRKFIAGMRFLLELAGRFFDRTSGRPLTTGAGGSVTDKALEVVIALRPLRQRLITQLEGIVASAREAGDDELAAAAADIATQLNAADGGKV